MNYFIKTFYQKKYPILFLDKTSAPRMLSEEKLDIILSPSFYWTRREELPVKSVFAAQKLIPSIFEPILPEGNYSYRAFKREGFFELFAYDDNQIVLFLDSIGIKSSQINAIYFAQNEIPPFEGALKINEQATMINTNGVFSMIPTQYAQETIDIEQVIPTLAYPKDKISIDLFKNFVLEEGQLYKVMASLLALILLYSVDYFNLRQELKIASLMQYKILDDYALPTTSIQLNSLKSELVSKENAQSTLRKGVKSVLSIPLLKEERFTELTAKKNVITFAIMLKDPKRAEELKKEIAKESQISTIKVIDSTLHVEVKL